ncbi:hypothetical protein DFW101_2687 [Solidesulfovibrio carbinoliphilus subsp. oakridgensis]|uniref:Uncharacterized protein n=1 Tax=Solidesulfovibrio carbinoliphilus subsp. oakridgensis TaxID=694327 RepID=G7QAD8_9BACT|nr:hypothetical protein [Solidesulfovibrio carbinoliphilus]EHJ48691.1 hypothetical protein DFW101_2687 [Solidesulfovibrio carbinoliphilus subsp. oakridgensis]
MDDAAATPSAAAPADREARFAACLEKLEELKAVKARREVLEERVFLEFLRANRGRINEFPLLETEQQSLMDMLLRRAEGLHPAHESIKERFSEYLLELNHYGKAKAVGDEARREKLARRLERVETLLAKCLQGAVYASSLVKDNFSDAIIRHFGENSLAKIEELTATLVFDELYWRTAIERFVKEEVRGAYDDILAERRYRLSREGQLLIVAFPFDAVLSKLMGTTKAISKTRVQTAFAEGTGDEAGRQNLETALAVLSRAEIPQWNRRAERDESTFAAQVAAMDAVVAEYRAGPAGEGEEAEARQAFWAEEITALCLGAAVSLRVVREDFARALRDFSPKETAWLVQSAGVFDALHLGLVLEHIMEFDFAYLLREKGEADAGRIQVKAARNRRAPRAGVDALVEAGFNKVRRRQFFDDDPDNPDFLLFRPKNPAELEERLRLVQIEPELARSLVALWETAPYKVDLYVCINLAALGKVATNLSARITEILGRYGIAPPGAGESARTKRDA